MARQPLSPLASELRETFRQIGPCTGWDAWIDLARRLEIARRQKVKLGAAASDMEPFIGDVPTHIDRHGRIRITQTALTEALIECERAGGIGCRNVHSSDPDQIFSWRPMPVEAPAPRQRSLFDGV